MKARELAWFKGVTALCAISLSTFLLVDVLSYSFFREEIREIFPRFGDSEGQFRRGFPRYHFTRSDSLGFDIAPSVRARTASHPLEYKEYDVWGNRFGCFDDEWKEDIGEDGIYLAGDSFTWGYVERQKHFGYLIEKWTDFDVFSCGVTHTGQRHQLGKFLELYGNVIRPDTVIVNVAENDVANDYFFPHTTVVDGYLVENIEWCIQSFQPTGEPNIRTNRISHEQARREYENKNSRQSKSRLGDFFINYSTTLNIVIEIYRKSSATIRAAVSSDSKGDPRVGSCREDPYGLTRFLNDENYRNSELASANRSAIHEWIDHADKNGYRLVFSLIPGKNAATHPDREPSYYLGLRRFLAEFDVDVWDFSDYLDPLGNQVSSLYYKFDGHLNELGNEHYAKFLVSRLQGGVPNRENLEVTAHKAARPVFGADD